MYFYFNLLWVIKKLSLKIPNILKQWPEFNDEETFANYK